MNLSIDNKIYTNGPLLVNSKRGKDVDKTTTGVTAPIGNLKPVPNTAFVDPIMPSDFFNKTDLKRFEKVQAAWAEEFSKRTGMPKSNIIARLPKVTLGDPKEMLSEFCLGYSSGDDLVINPIKELHTASGEVYGSVVVHESYHALMGSLRQSLAKDFSIKQIIELSSNIVLDKVKKGEQGFILKSMGIFRDKDENFLVKNNPMQAPLLSKEEREAVVGVANELDASHWKACELSDLGVDYVNKKLMPKLTKFKSTFDGIYDNSAEEASRRICNYFNSISTRVHFLAQAMVEDKIKSEGSKNPALAKPEIKMAKEAWKGFLSTHEGNIWVSDQNLENYSQPVKLYFTCFEESNARKEEGVYALNTTIKKIKGFLAKGLTPPKALIEQRQVAQTNVKLVLLSNKLMEIEQKIISAPKNYDNVRDYNNSVEILKKVIESPKTQEVLQITKNLRPKLAGLSHAEQDKLITDTLGPEKTKIFYEYIDVINYYFPKMNKINTPINMMADTEETKPLRNQYTKVLNEIRKIAYKSNLSSIPEEYFESNLQIRNSLKNVEKVFEKWIIKLKIAL